MPRCSITSTIAGSGRTGSGSANVTVVKAPTRYGIPSSLASWPKVRPHNSKKAPGKKKCARQMNLRPSFNKY
jgi:hypothetical protein